MGYFTTYCAALFETVKVMKIKYWEIYRWGEEDKYNQGIVSYPGWDPEMENGQ